MDRRLSLAHKEVKFIHNYLVRVPGLPHLLGTMTTLRFFWIFLSWSYSTLFSAHLELIFVSHIQYTYNILFNSWGRSTELSEYIIRTKILALWLHVASTNQANKGCEDDQNQHTLWFFVQLPVLAKLRGCSSGGLTTTPQSTLKYLENISTFCKWAEERHRDIRTYGELT